MVQHLGIDRVLNIISGMARRGCKPGTRSYLGLFYNFTNRCSLSVTILNRTKHLDLSYLAIILIFFLVLCTCTQHLPFRESNHDILQ